MDDCLIFIKDCGEQFLRNGHCTEGVLRIGCHEISKKFQPVLEPDWSAAQQYNHMFQRSTVKYPNGATFWQCGFQWLS